MVTRESMRRWARLGAVFALASAGAIAAIGTASAAPVTEEFEFTGEAEEFVVPADVCAVTIDALGAQGGDFDAGDLSSIGGFGGQATATIAVIPGETLVVRVGGRGDDSATIDALGDSPDEQGVVREGQVGVLAAGGFNGGGDAADGISTPAAGGGGGSDVRQGGDALEHRVVVAGGGGGAGGDDNSPGVGDGGAGGGSEGEDGEDSASATEGGGGGTQTGGGDAGAGDPTATAGELGQGGQGGAGEFVNDGGGGGGGGYYGGGGGAGDTDGLDDGGGGGGGSGFGPADVEFETGVQEGDGFVSITYDPAEETCLPPIVEPVLLEPTFTG